TIFGSPGLNSISSAVSGWTCDQDVPPLVERHIPLFAVARTMALFEGCTMTLRVLDGPLPVAVQVTPALVVLITPPPAFMTAAYSVLALDGSKARLEIYIHAAL